MSAQNPTTPPNELHALLPAPVLEAIAKVDKLAARMADANERHNTYGPKAEQPDKWHGDAVRAAVAAGGSSADVVDQRAEWADLFRQAREDQAALRPLLVVAWRDLRAALNAHSAEALALVEPVVEAEANTYREALDAAEQAAASHRAALTLRGWITSATREGGPDTFRGSREVDVAAGTLRAKPSEALAVLRADADSLTTTRKAESDEAARRDYNTRVAAERAAAAAQRDAQEKASMEAHRLQREQARAAEVEATAAREAAAIPGTPAA